MTMQYSAVHSHELSNWEIHLILYRQMISNSQANVCIACVAPLWLLPLNVADALKSLPLMAKYSFHRVQKLMHLIVMAIGLITHSVAGAR